MPQHWVNVFIGAILILAVLADIWVRQEGILATWWAKFRRKDSSHG
jgi:ribose transport system permease protein